MEIRLAVSKQDSLGKGDIGARNSIGPGTRVVGGSRPFFLLFFHKSNNYIVSHLIQ